MEPQLAADSALVQALKRKVIIWMLCALSVNRSIPKPSVRRELQRMPWVVSLRSAIIRVRALLTRWMLPQTGVVRWYDSWASDGGQVKAQPAEQIAPRARWGLTRSCIAALPR